MSWRGQWNEPAPQRHFLVVTHAVKISNLARILKQCRISIISANGKNLMQTGAPVSLAMRAGRKIIDLVAKLKESSGKSLKKRDLLLLPPCAAIDPSNLAAPVTGIRFSGSPLQSELRLFIR